MSALTRPFRRRLRRGGGARRGGATPGRGADAEPAPFEIAPDDPLLAYFQGVSGAVDIDTLELDSPALRELKDAGVKLAVPLVSQGELIGVLNLGPRLSEQDYSSDDRKLLDNLAAQAAPALRVGQLVREQEAEAATRQRFEHELEVARLIQHHFLPRELPDLAGWQIAAYYRPAQEVGGDFYDVIPLADGRVAFVVGDVTDKGVPAALVDVRHPLGPARHRAAAGRARRRARVRQRPPLPGHAGEDVRHLPVRGARSAQRRVPLRQRRPRPAVRQDRHGVNELRARGMPLGLMPGHDLRGERDRARPGDCVLLHSDGIVEAHSPDARHVRLPAPEGDRRRAPRAGRR